MTSQRLKFVLVILDGLGLRDSKHANAFRLARTPALDRLLREHPWTSLEAAGPAVGLPEGVIGNSEVGHLTIGAGRIVRHDLVRINEAIDSDNLGKSTVLRDVFSFVRENKTALHLLGLVSDAGVHSHLDHLFALLKLAKEEGINPVYVHAVTDGRDTSPRSGVRYVRQVMKRMGELGVGAVATVMGRYYAMDRDKRWERTELAYRALVAGKGESFADSLAAIQASYDRGVTDEFIRPVVLNSGNGVPTVKENDALFCFNFRADRMRQIARALGGEEFQEFPRVMGPVFTATMTSYDDTFTFPVVFSPVSLTNIFGEVLANEGYHQLRVAETEKYAHVTYFFNGGKETPLFREDRILIPSPKVATYDQMPEMSAEGIKDTVLQAIDDDSYDCIIVNLANPDMVGHTGNLKATVRAVEEADRVTGEVVDAAVKQGAAAFITADHGNAEIMEAEDGGEEHTAHTVNPVPFIPVSPSPDEISLDPGGGLADVAPTILDFLGISIPSDMTGRSLLIRS
ncbi:MAG: 2,3-bisphosphoglycerate-independent phosphoglycerate mutase [Fidelibacterota bacterium]